MILGFKPQFVSEIESGKKVHTIRRGFRWKAGNTIQFATGVRTKNYNQFKSGVCDGVEEIRIMYVDGDLEVRVGGHTLAMVERLELAKKDGFDDYHEFVRWFYDATEKGKEDFLGQIVHWTKMRYA